MGAVRGAGSESMLGLTPGLTGSGPLLPLGLKLWQALSCPTTQCWDLHGLQGESQCTYVVNKGVTVQPGAEIFRKLQ